MSDDAPAPTPVDITWSTTVGLAARPKSGSAVGVKATWEVIPDDRNLDEKYVDPNRRTQLGPATVTGTDDGWRSFVRFAPVSGNRYRLVARTAGASGEVVKDVTVVTRQTLPITVYHVDSSALAAWNAAFPLIQAAYDKVGITLDVKAKVKTDRGDRPLYKGEDPDGMNVDRTNRQATPDDFRKGLGAFFTSGELPPVKPSFGHLRVFVLGKLEQYYDFMGGGGIDRATALAMSSGAAKLNAVPPGASVKLAPNPVIEAKLAFPVMSWGDVDVKAKARRENDKQISFRWDRAFVDKYFGGSATAELVVKFEVNESGFLGWSDGRSLIAVATKKANGGAVSKTVLARSVIHEVGHALGLVQPSRALPPGSRERNDFYYQEMGGKGPHCRKDAEVSRGVVVPGRKKLCVMYHAGGPDDHADAAFCASCTTDMRLVDLGLLGPRKDWS